MTELYKQFKKEKPETVGETDKEFDQSNYIDWLEAKLQGQTLPLDSLSVSSFCRLPRINCFSGICETCGKTH